MEPQEAIERYAELKQQISELEKELDDLKGVVFANVDAQEGMFESDRFVLKTQKRAKYKFSPVFDAKSKELKELRKREIDEGVAEIEGYSEFVTIKFKH